MRRPPLLALVLIAACNQPAGDAPPTEKADAAKQPAKVDEKPAVEPPTSEGPGKSETPDKPDEPDIAPEPVPPPVEPAIPPATDPVRLLIGDDEGLHEYDLEGKRLATLVKGAAWMPRVLVDGRVVFLREGELWTHTPGGETKRVAELPRRWKAEACKAETGKLRDEDVQLDVQAPGDFRLDASKQEACLRLQDRNDNMVSFGVAVWVELATGKLRQTPMVDLEGECVPEEQEAGYCYDLPLERPDPPASTASFPFAYDPESGKLSGSASASTICRAPAGPAECAGVERRSFGGRFELLSGEMDGGDYIYRELVVLDRQDGTLWALPADSNATSLLAIQPSDVFAGGLHEAWSSQPGEADVRWLPEDRLWIEGKLIDPAKRTIVKLGGSLAFRLGGA
ncbi:hypothetical protein ACNOYE_08420 [Nannocystaceae bacterium ST9]